MGIIVLLLLSHFCERSGGVIRWLENWVEAEAMGSSFFESYFSLSLAVEAFERVGCA